MIITGDIRHEEWELEEQVVVDELNTGRPSLTTASSASPYLLSEVGHQWLIPAVWKHIKSCAIDV